MLLKILTAGFILFGSCVTAQSLFDRIDAVPAENPDTLYYPFNEDSLQLVIINTYDHWRRKGAAYDAMYPRSGSWFMDHGPAPRNSYLWRNRSGEVVKQYHTKQGSTLHLRNTDYTSRNNFGSIGADVSDYYEFFGRFKIYGENNLEGLINLKGEIVLPAVYEYIVGQRISAAIISGEFPIKLHVRKDGKVGMLNADLTELVPPVYDEINDYELIGPYFKVIKDGKYGVIDQTGKVVVEPRFDELSLIHDSMVIAQVYHDSATLQKIPQNTYWDQGYKIKDCRVFDPDFRVIADLKDYEYLCYWATNQFIVKKHGQFGVLNNRGAVVIPLKYDHMFFTEGYFLAEKEGRNGLINTEGKVVLPVDFTRVEIYGKAVYVVKDGLTGVYSDQFRLIAEPQFTERRWEMGRYILTRPDGSEGFVNHTEKEGCYYQSPEGEIQKL